MIDRIKQTIEYSQLSASAFADTIGISRSGLTHLLTGRNQPSLDVARKILAKYPEISTEWLIMGMGDMFRSDEAGDSSTITHKESLSKTEHRDENSKFDGQSDLFAEFGNADDSEQDMDEDVTVEEPVEDVEFSVDEQDTDAAPVEEAISAPIEAPVQMERKPVAQSRPRKAAVEPKPAPSRRERHIPVSAQEKKIQKIIFFFDDQSFEIYRPS